MDQAVEFDPILMQNAYINFYQYVFVDSAKREFDRIRRMNRKEFIPDGFFLSTWKEWIGQWVINNLGTMITNVNENTLGKIQLVLAKATEEGLNPFETEKYIREFVGSKARALGIARTEGTRANSMGKERSASDWANETGTELWKLWVHGGSREPRPEHIVLGTRPPIPKYHKFQPVNLEYPGDPSGTPEQTINCSCTVVYVSTDYVRRYYPELV